MKKIDEKIKINIINDYINSEKSFEELGKCYKINHETIRYWLKKINNKNINMRVLKNKKNNLPINKHIPWTKKDDEILKKGLISGTSPKDLSKLLGRSLFSIYARKKYLVANGFIKDDLRFKSLKSSQKEDVKKQEDKKIKESERIKINNNKIDKENEINLENAKLNDLVNIAKKYNINISIFISKNETEIKLF